MTTTYDKKKDPAPSGSTTDENNKPAENSAEGASLDEPQATQENSAKIPGYFLPAWAAAVFNAGILDDEACGDRVQRASNPPWPCCPHCEDEFSPVPGNLYNYEHRYTCKACGRWFTARTGTFLQGSQLSYSQVFLMAVLIDFMQNGLTPARIAQAVGVSADTVRIWIKRFKVFDGE